MGSSAVLGTKSPTVFANRRGPTCCPPLLLPEQDGRSRPTRPFPVINPAEFVKLKIDVYGFGVVLLEILTGKPPIYRGSHIVKEVRNRFERDGLDGVREILDPSLREALPEELETFTTIALMCVEDTALERPHMHDVVKQLENLVGPKAHLMPGASAVLEVHSDASST